MTRLTFPRLLAWWAAIALVLVVLGTPPSARAQDTGCIAVDQNELPRDCTFLEEHGACLVNALDSYDTCIESVDSLMDRIVCEAGVQVDLFACNVALPWHLLKMVVE